MATVGLAVIGNALMGLVGCDDLQPGDLPSYEQCKAIYLYHPLGGKMAKSPVVLAQSQLRETTVPLAPKQVVEAFLMERKKLRANPHIRNCMTLARVYGIASLAMLTEGEEPSSPVDWENLHKKQVTFNAYDPLNTAGSMVLNLDPLASDFLKPTGIAVQGKAFHPSRTVAVLNEEPIYLAYTASAWGYVGRSVYQRALFPLKSFINTMRADDMVARKAGLLIAKIKAAGSITDNIMMRMFGLKRQLLKEAGTDNVLSIDPTEDIETLNMQNVNSAMKESRDNILKNCAVAADMPAKLLDNETFVEGFGEGTEDAKNTARYIDGIRIDMEPLDAFFDRIAMYRAWNPDFYRTIQKLYPDDYGDRTYNDAFTSWQNSFTAIWPSLLKEPESEEIKVHDVKLKAAIALLEVLAPMLDPQNRTDLIQFAVDAFNDLKLLFESPLLLDFEALESFAEEQADQAKKMMAAGGQGGEDQGEPTGGPKEPATPKPFAAQDAVERYDESVAMLLDSLKKRQSRGRAAHLRKLEEAE